MSLKLVDTYFPTQNCLVYTGLLAGKVSLKRKIWQGRIWELSLTKLPKNKRYNLRVRGSDEGGNRYLPLQCHCRTDGAGDLYIADKWKPQIDHYQEPDDPHPELEPQFPQPTKLALVINSMLNKPK